jgi:hypothetical protein
MLLGTALAEFEYLLMHELRSSWLMQNVLTCGENCFDLLSKPKAQVQG